MTNEQVLRDFRANSRQAMLLLDKLFDHVEKQRAVAHGEVDLGHAWNIQWLLQELTLIADIQFQRGGFAEDIGRKQV